MTEQPTDGMERCVWCDQIQFNPDNQTGERHKPWCPKDRNLSLRTDIDR